MISVQRCLATLTITLVFSASTASAFEVSGFRWIDSLAVIGVDIDGTSPSGGTWDAEFIDATNLWNDVVPGFRFETSDQHSNPCAGFFFPDGTIPFPEDYRQGVGFSPTDCGLSWGGGTLAITYIFTDGITGGAIDADIIFNSNIAWDVYSGPIQNEYVDFRRVAAHELGHFAGLNHVVDGQALMHPWALSAEKPTADDIAGLNALYPEETVLEPIRVSLEEPVDNLVHGGIGNLRGWAVATTGVVKVEIYIDGEYMFDAPFGGDRTDVGGQFPDFPDAEQSGFSLAYGYSNLSTGTHTITARAFDKLGDFKDSSSTFSIVSFHKDFIPSTDTIETGQAVMTSGGDEILLKNVTIDGHPYDLTLKWRTAEQGFEIIEIR